MNLKCKTCFGCAGMIFNVFIQKNISRKNIIADETESVSPIHLLMSK